MSEEAAWQASVEFEMNFERRHAKENDILQEYSGIAERVQVDRGLGLACVGMGQGFPFLKSVLAQSSFHLMDLNDSLGDISIRAQNGPPVQISEQVISESAEAKVILDRHKDRKGKGLWVNQVRIGPRDLGISIGHKRRGLDSEKADPHKIKKEAKGTICRGAGLEADIHIN